MDSTARASATVVNSLELQRRQLSGTYRYFGGLEMVICRRHAQATDWMIILDGFMRGNCLLAAARIPGSDRPPSLDLQETSQT